MTQAAVHDAIRTKLTASQGAGTFYAALGASTASGFSGKALWFTEAPPGEEGFPLCIYTFIADVPERYFTTDNLDMTLQFDLYADKDDSKPESLVAINDKLIALMDKVDLTITGYTGGQSYCTNRGALEVDGDTWRIRSEYRIFGASSS